MLPLSNRGWKLMFLTGTLALHITAPMATFCQESIGVWQANLKGDDDWNNSLRSIDTNGFRKPKVDFLNDGTIVVSFMCWPERQGPPDQAGVMQSIALKSLFFDARNGHLRDTLRWTARRDAAQLRPVHNGGFIVHAGDKLMRYGPDLKVLRERDLVPGAVSLSNGHLAKQWEMAVAPGGKTIVMQLLEDEEVKSLWISADSFEDLFSATRNLRARAIVAEDALALMKSPKRPNLSEVWLWERGKDWRQITSGFKPETFLAGDLLLLVSGKGKGYEVSDREGNTRQRGTLKHADPSAITVTSNLDGTCFALLDSHRPIPGLQKRDFFEWKYEVLVGYGKSQQLRTKISLGTHDGRAVDIALSPDCSELAALTGSTLRLYELH